MTDWKVAAKAESYHENPAKPKTQDGSDTNCYVYVPGDWLGETVLALIGVEDPDIDDEGDGVNVVCEAIEFDRPKAYKRGTGAAIFVHGDYAQEDVIVLRNAKSFAMEKEAGEDGE